MKWKAPLSVCVFCFSVSAVPLINKAVFSGAAPFPYPIATAFLQLGAVAVVLVAVSAARAARGGGGSWIGGPNFAWKLRFTGPVGFLFGIKYGITNWGLQLVPIGVHVLLQSTDLIWTCIFAWFINREERPLTEYS